jgi:hypothetical protein
LLDFKEDGKPLQINYNNIDPNISAITLFKNSFPNKYDIFEHLNVDDDKNNCLEISNDVNFTIGLSENTKKNFNPCSR